MPAFNKWDHALSSTISMALHDHFQGKVQDMMTEGDSHITKKLSCILPPETLFTSVSFSFCTLIVTIGQLLGTTRCKLMISHLIFSLASLLDGDFRVHKWTRTMLCLFLSDPEQYLPCSSEAERTVLLRRPASGCQRAQST